MRFAALSTMDDGRWMIAGVRPRLIRSTLLLFLLFASGCQKEVTIRHQPEIPAPEHWTVAGTDSSEIRAEWWKTFEDSQLDELVGRALQRNYNLMAASARVLAAAAQAKIAGADQLPSISAGWSGRGQRQNFIGLPIPGADGDVLSRTFKTSGVSLDVSWEVDIWGRISAGKAAAIADLEATDADLRAARLSLAAQTTKAWLAILESVEQIQLAERTVESYQDTANRVRRRYRMGIQPSLDLRLALSSLASAEALLEQRHQQLDRSTRQLEILLGDYPAGLIQSAKPLPTLPPHPPAGVPSELVSRRPDLIAAERRMLAAGARWNQSKAALYPSISLSGGIGTSTSGFHQIFNGNFFIWNLAGNVLQPVFQGGRLKAQVVLRDAQSKEAAAQWASNLLLAFSEVESALAAERFLAEQQQDLETAAQQATASLNLAEDRYDSGLENFVTVLESQRRSLESESQLLNVRRQRLDARVDLHLALGGGLEDSETVETKESES